MRASFDRRDGRYQAASAWLAGAALLAGCSGTVVTSSDASTSSTRALLSVEHTEIVSAFAGTPVEARGRVGAYFMRLQSAADQAIASRLVGEAPSLPRDGECEAVQVLGDQGIPLASLGPVELVDVGEIVVQAAQTRATLATRAFPNVVDLISGVVYTTRARTADALPDRGAYAFHISGSTALPGMTVEAVAPGGVKELMIAGQPLHGAPAILPRGDLAISWQPQAPGDVLYIELASAEDGPLERVRCGLGHSGRATIPANVLPRATSQSLSVHLVRREPVTAPGLDAGEVRFDWTTTGAVRFETLRP